MNKIINIFSRKCFEGENLSYFFVFGFREVDWYEIWYLFFDCIG